MNPMRRSTRGWGFALLIGVALGFGISRPVRADDVYQVVVKKQEQKKKTRWSIIDWFDTSEKMKIQDMWLAMHSPSPFEFWLGAHYAQLAAQAGWRAFFAANASIVGLEFQMENLGAIQWYGLFHLRLFGHSAQGTNLTLGGGLRSTDQAGTSYRSPLVDGSLTLYLFKFFGFEGLYRYYFPSTPTATGSSLSGYRWEAGAFIDFSLFRVYGTYVTENLGSSVTGVNAGFKLFF